MAKTTGPALSLDASGTIADTLTFGKWKGIGYVRQRVIPSNPNTTGQQTTRNIFTWTGNIWKNAPSLFRAPWERFVSGVALNPNNAFQGQNIAAMRGDTDLANMIGSPGAKGGIAPDSIALTAGSQQITVDFTNPTPPTGWTLESVIAAAIRDQDPQSGLLYTITADEDDVSQAQVVLSGLTASELYFVMGWTRWSKADGSIAYGPSLIDSATPTA